MSFGRLKLTPVETLVTLLVWVFVFAVGFQLLFESAAAIENILELVLRAWFRSLYVSFSSNSTITLENCTSAEFSRQRFSFLCSKHLRNFASPPFYPPPTTSDISSYATPPHHSPHSHPNMSSSQVYYAGSRGPKLQLHGEQSGAH